MKTKTWIKTWMLLASAVIAQQVLSTWDSGIVIALISWQSYTMLALWLTLRLHP